MAFETFSVADSYNKGQIMQQNRMKLQDLMDKRESQAQLDDLARRSMGPDGTVNVDSYIKGRAQIPGQGAVALEMQLAEQDRVKSEKVAEAEQARKASEQYAKTWTETLKPGVSAYIANPTPEGLAELNALYQKVAPELANEKPLPSDPALAAKELKIFTPMMDAHGELFKLQSQATDALAQFGEQDPRTKAALKQLMQFEDETKVKQDKAQADLDRVRQETKLAERRDGAEKPPSGYRWGEPDAEGNPTLVPITGSKADMDRKQSEKEEDATKASNDQTIATIDSMIKLVEDNPRSTATLLAPIARGLEAVTGVFDPTGKSKPGISFRQNRDNILGISRDLFRAGRLTNQQLEKIESALGGTTVTTPQNTIDALNEVKNAIRGGEATPEKPGFPKSKRFEEGKIYTDSQGNRAKYVNGKWVEQ